MEKHAIKISVKPHYLPEQSNALDDQYAFAYTITIENLGLETVTLRRRFWHISDAQGHSRTVEGAGVVGEEPTLEPMESFTYTSGVQLKTPWGKMHGYFEFEVAQNTSFRVPIEEFSLESAWRLQ